MKVGLFIPCLVDQFYPSTAIAVVKILKKFKVDFDYPQQQTCCGQPAYNTGYRKEAAKMAEKFIDNFIPFDCIIAPSGSCTSMVKLLYPNLEFSDEYQKKCKELVSKVYEFSDFLVNQLKVTDTGSSFKGKVTYHSSCHLTRELGIKNEPRILISGMKNVEFIESENTEECCGFGGTFSIKFPELSTSMGEDKVKGMLKTGAEYIIGGDNSCLMQIDGIINKNKFPIKTIHLAEALAEGL
jgi:L-lactate dehydrogenase complex protein LldE